MLFAMPCRSSSGGTLLSADALFAKGKYQEALAVYDAASAKHGESGLRAAYRSVECRALLFRYGEAAQRVFDMELPSDPLWKARMLLLRAETGREFLEQYGYSLPAEEQKGATDVTKLTRSQIEEKINAAYDKLWELRGTLAGKPLKKEDYFIDVQKVDFEKYTTLWDFAVLRWTSWLREHNASSSGQTDALKFATDDYYAAFDFAAPAPLKAAAIYEGGGVTHSGRETASELWRMERLRIGIEWGIAGDVAAYEKAQLPVLEKWGESLPSFKVRALADYFAADIYNRNGKYARAVELCDKGRAASESSDGGKLCAVLEAQIKAPQMSLTAKNAPPPGKGILSFKLRNINKVYMRAWRTTPAELATLPKPQYGRSREGFEYLREINGEGLDYFLSRRADKTWSDTVAYSGPYQYADAVSSSPALGNGIYVIAASSDPKFSEGSSLIQGTLVNVTDILVFASAGLAGNPEDFLFDPENPGRKAQSEVMRWYGVNALTGLPLDNATLTLLGGRSWNENTRTDLNTNAEGFASWSMPVSLNYASGSDSAHQDALLSFGNAYSWPGEASGFYYSVEQPVRVFVETDREIYRPGQTVKFKITALLRRPGGWKTYDGKSQLAINVRDTDWKEVFVQKITPGPMGTASGEFTLPSTGLLGNYRMSVSLREYGREFNDEKNLRVEEYKRPEFEITLAAGAGAFRYGQKARVEGDAKYYFGSPVTNSDVEYTITRRVFIPWFFWWYEHFTSEGGTEIARGKVSTGTDGHFTIDFVPEPAANDSKWPATYEVAVSAHDSGGRTIEESHSYRAGEKAYMFELTPKAGFFNEGKKAAVSAKLLNLNEEPVEGLLKYKLCRVEGEPEKPEFPHVYGRFMPQPDDKRDSLDYAYRNVPDGKQAAQGEVRVRAAAPSDIKLPSLDAGVYRLTVSSTDPWGGECSQSVIIVVVPSSGEVKLKLPAVAIFESPSYRRGETARVLVGAGALKGAKFAEIMAGSNILERRLLRNAGAEVMAIKVSSALAGGFGVQWFGASDFLVYEAGASAAVPRVEKELSLDLHSDKTMEPGATAHWSMGLKDHFGKPVSGEAVLRVYDRSLDYYMHGAGEWIASLYADRKSSNPFQYVNPQAPGCALPVRSSLIEQMAGLFHAAENALQDPALRMTKSRTGHSSLAERLAETAAMSSLGANAAASLDEESFEAARSEGAAKKAKVAFADMSVPAAANATMGVRGMAGYAGAAGGAPSPAPAEPVHVRSDFSETAYYNPQINIENGKGEFSFKMPERLTSWSISGYALTRDVKRGTVAAQVVTRKDLMVRLDIPRFLREGDKSALKALVSNESDRELSGDVILSMNGDDGDAGAVFALDGAAKSFSVKPQATQALSWDVSAPHGVAAYKVRAVARAGEYSDAQENDLPLLPSRARLPASTIGVLDGNSKVTLKLTELLKSDASREMETAQLSVDPQLALSVLNSLPLLVNYPYECTEQVMDRYVPLSIVNSFYSKYPQLAASVAKIPKRDTITPAWNANDPVRMTMISESPWLVASGGRRTSLPLTDMFNPKFVEAERAGALAKIASYQNGDGSFPWFPGGRPDLYMTLVVLDGFGEAARYGVPVRDDIVRRALAYVNGEMPKYMKPEESATSMLLYAAYVTTAFPNLPESKQARANAKLWVDYADMHSDAMTAFGHAHAAYVYLRLGEKDKAENHLDRAMDGARSDSVAGVYWTPEKMSWLWYSDSVEKHAFLLRTLLALRPHDARIPGMVQWLLFNRKGNEWKSTKASAAAIYSLLDVMKSRGSLDKGDSFTLNWSTMTATLDVEPMDWLAKPVSYTLYGHDADSAATATVGKQGPGLAFATLSAIYSTDMPVAESPSGMMNVSRKYFLRRPSGKGYELVPLADGDTVHVGDQLEVQLAVDTRSQFEYVQLKDPRGAGFEGENLLSGWKWEQLGRYEEPRDSLTNFFMDWLPHGEYTLSYRIRPTTPGVYKIAPAVMQSIYAPEFSAHSAGMTLTVKE
jgi:uncharacterized protein YfaS (alpha-2-macroglobulin family)